MKLDISLSQKQTLSPQMLQTMEIMAMNVEQLIDYIENAALENPVLDIHPNDEGEEEWQNLVQRIKWLDNYKVAIYNDYTYNGSEESGDEEWENESGTEEDLSEHLTQQLLSPQIPTPLRKIARMLVLSLDNDGYLRESLEDLCVLWGCSPETMEAALACVQSLEPAGVGARTLAECLCLQLYRNNGSKLAIRIAQDYLDEVSQGLTGQIAEMTGATGKEVQAALDEIKLLNPHPGNGFKGHSATIFIRPDVYIFHGDNHLNVQLNDHSLPLLNINPEYSAMIRPDTEPELRRYLTTQLTHAKSLIEGLNRRQNNLRNCAEIIAERQKRFFSDGPDYLQPLSMAEAAEELDVHISTVSRIVKDKYLQCSLGVFPLNYFFCRKIGITELSAREIKTALRSILTKEDGNQPFTDQQLCEILTNQGFNISRRTIAKYRDEMEIPRASQRRRP